MFLNSTLYIKRQRITRRRFFFFFLREKRQNKTNATEKNANDVIINVVTCHRSSKHISLPRVLQCGEPRPARRGTAVWNKSQPPLDQETVNGRGGRIQEGAVTSRGGGVSLGRSGSHFSSFLRTAFRSSFVGRQPHPENDGIA